MHSTNHNIDASALSAGKREAPLPDQCLGLEEIEPRSLVQGLLIVHKRIRDHLRVLLMLGRTIQR